MENKKYEAPQVEIIEVKVELGFACSNTIGGEADDFYFEQ